MGQRKRVPSPAKLGAPRARRILVLGVGVVLASALAALLPRGAYAADAGGRESSSPSACPDPDAVWSSVTALVPSAAAQMLAAKPRVAIVDLGVRYRVRVEGDSGSQERTYTDPGRHCAKRSRFAAEFIVVALLPPYLGLAEPPASDAAGGSELGSSSATTQGAENPGAAVAESKEGTVESAAPPSPAPLKAPPPSDAKSTPTEASGPLVRIEAFAVAELAPPILGAVETLTWGPELRTQVGSGRFAGTAALGYQPKQAFGAGALRAALTRWPASVGVRVRWWQGGFDGFADLGVAFALERYEGLSPHVPQTTSRFSPGLAAAWVASTSAHAVGGAAIVLRIQCEWLPVKQSLETAPQGEVAKAPSLWAGLALGVSLGL